MTWRNAKADARHRFDAWVAAGNDSNALRRAEVRVSLYQSTADLQFLQPGTDWTADYHAMVMRAFKRILLSHGARVRFVTLKVSDYFDFIAKHDLPNDAASRARFIADRQYDQETD